MKLIIRLITVAVLSSGFFLVAAPKKSDEAGKSTPKAEKPGAKAADTSKLQHLPLKGTVIAITTRTLTLKGGEGKDDRKFTINKDTEIVKGEAAAKTEDVKVGQIITGSYVRNAEGANTLTKLQIAPKPAPAKKADAKEEEGKTKKTESPAKKAAEGEAKKETT